MATIQIYGTLNSEPKLQDKTIAVTSNGDTTVQADSDYDGLGTVEINTNVTPNLQDKSIEITENGTSTISADEGYDGLSEVEVTTNVPNDATEFMNETFAGSGTASSIGVWYKNIKKLKINYVSGTTIKSMLRNFNGTTIEFGTNINTSSITDMQDLFTGCSNLTSILNLDKLDTSNVTTMVSMFQLCEQLTRLDLKSFDTTALTNVKTMFRGARALMFLDIRTFDFSTITTTTDMFGGSSSQELYYRIPANCEIIVKDNDAKTYINTNFSWLTNVKTVEEYEQQNS